MNINPMTDRYITDLHMDDVRQRPPVVIEVREGQRPPNIVFDAYYMGRPWDPKTSNATPSIFGVIPPNDVPSWWYDTFDDDSPAYEMDGNRVKLILCPGMTEQPGDVIVMVDFIDQELSHLTHAVCILRVVADPYRPRPKETVTVKLETTSGEFQVNGQTITFQAKLIDQKTGQEGEEITFDKPDYC